MKLIIIAIAITSMASSAFAGFASVNGHLVYFGQSGHWAIQYNDNEENDNIWRNDGDAWSFPQDQDEDQDNE